jgi:hypothetical protein
MGLNLCRMDLTPKWDSTQNGLNTEWEDSTSNASQPLNGYCFFSLILVKTYILQGGIETYVKSARIEVD